MKGKISVLLLVCLVVGFSALTTSAQTQEQTEKPPNLSIEYHFKAKPDRVAQFEAALKAHLEWAKEAKDPWTWITLQITTGERYGEYVIISPNHSWADLDKDVEFAQKRINNFRLTATPLLESYSREISEFDTTNVNWPDDPDDYAKIVEFFTYYIKVGQKSAFFEAVGKFHQAFVQAKYPAYYLISSVRTGGDINRVRVIIPHPNWADFEEPEKSMGDVFVEVYGQEGAKALGEKLYNATYKVESMVLQRRPDLSYTPEK
jgi:hypothetical protein